MHRYFNEVLYVSSGTPLSDQISSGSVIQLSRVQSVDYDFEWPSNDVSYLDEGVNSQQIQRASVRLTFEYFPTAGENERRIGFLTDGVSAALSLLNQEKNYYYLYGPGEGEAIALATGDPREVMAFGNMVLNGYSIAAGVGDLLRATCMLEGLNCILHPGSSGEQIPAIDLETQEEYTGLFALQTPVNHIYNDTGNPSNNITALGAKDLEMRFPTGSAFATFISGDGCILQSFNLAFSVDRIEARCLGHPYPKERRVAGPVQVELSVEAVLNSFQVAHLSDLRCEGQDIDIIAYQPCNTGIAIAFGLKNLTLRSQNVVQSMDDYSRVAFNWSAQTRINDNLTILSTANNTDFDTGRPAILYYMFDEFEDYATGDIGITGLLRSGWHYLISGYPGEPTGIFLGRTVGFFTSTSGYGANEFEVYNTGNIQFLGPAIAVNVPGFGTGYFTGYDDYFYDLLEQYPTGSVALMDSGIVTGSPNYPSIEAVKTTGYFFTP